MKYLLYACLVFSPFLIAKQQEVAAAISVQHPDTTLLTDIEATSNRLIAVGKHGVVITSEDAEQWQQATVPTQVLLTAVEFVDDETGWACGHDATIIKTSDAGNNWQLQQSFPDSDKPCLDIMFIDSQRGFAVGAYGMFYETTDGGQRWTKRFLDSLLFSDDRDYLNDLKQTDPQGYEIETASILPHFNRIVATDDGLMLVGEMGLMAVSTDDGETWQRLDEIYMGSFFAFNAELANQVVAGLRGNIFVSHGDNEWQQLSNPSHATINSITKHGQQLLLFANSGVLLTYTNNQLSQQQMADGKALLDGVVFNNKLVMASESGIKVKELTK